ncbi:hypothetical protein L9F63_024698, partial [Diploptera punctata]
CKILVKKCINTNYIKRQKRFNKVQNVLALIKMCKKHAQLTISDAKLQQTKHYSE